MLYAALLRTDPEEQTDDCVMDPMPIIVPIKGKKFGLYYITEENGVLCEF